MRYNTNQREKILQYIKENRDEHFTADSIVKHFAGTEDKVAKATVYRYLEVLVNESIIRRYVIDEGEMSCYQYVSDNGECHMHYHFKCSSCGKLIHVSCGLMDQVKAHVLMEHDFVIDSCKTVFYGECSECRKKNNI